MIYFYLFRVFYSRVIKKIKMCCPRNVDALGSLQRRLPINPPLYIGPRGRPTQLQ